MWLAIVLITEIFFFNFPSFHLIGGGYEKSPLPMADASIIGGNITEDGGIETQGEPIILEWRGIDRRIGTVSLDADFSGASYAELSADASDDTNAEYRYSIASKKLLPGDTRSHTMIIRMSGNVRDLRLYISVPDGGSLRLRGVTVNSAVPFRFSVLRAGLLMIIGIFVWSYFYYKHMKLPCSENKKSFTLAANSVTVLCLTAAFFMVGLYMTAHSNGFLSEFRLTSGNQITQEIVDAFEHGQVSLLAEPSKELLMMDNPYDWSARNELNVSYLWDHCLYNGNYYSYYGIAPVLLLFLPYHMITGYYFSTIIAIFIFGALGIVFLSETYKVFIRKFFPQLPLRTAIFGLLMLQMSSGVWYCFCAMNFYEIAQSAGLCFVTAGAYFLLSANVIGKERVSPVRTAAATACLSLAVLSRPTTAVYCAVSLLFLGFGLKKLISEYKFGPSKKQKSENGEKAADDVLSESPAESVYCTRKADIVAFTVAAIIPFMLFGGLQMIYNYLRFDSFLDFGIQYSLTINDFTRSEFHARFVSIGLYNYLLSPPVITPEFPYVGSSFQTLNPNGYYFVANEYAVGLIWRAAPVLGLLLAPKALKKVKKEKRLPAALLVGSFSVVAPFAVMFSIWESGYGARYAVDFGWEMIIGALAVLFFLYDTNKNKDMRSLADKAALISLIPTAVINFALIYAFFTNEVKSSAAVYLYNYLDSVFNFWF